MDLRLLFLEFPDFFSSQLMVLHAISDPRLLASLPLINRALRKH
jgi:hypothetical protein